MSPPNPGTAFLNLEFPVEVWLAEEAVPLGRLLDLEPGGVLALSRDPDAPVDLVVDGTVVASGELVVVDGKFAVRVTETASQKLAELGGASGEEATS